MYMRRRAAASSMPAAYSHRNSVLPARPANGSPPDASTLPGACPTIMTRGETASETIGATPACSSHRRHAVRQRRCSARLILRSYQPRTPTANVIAIDEKHLRAADNDDHPRPDLAHPLAA